MADQLDDLVLGGTSVSLDTDTYFAHLAVGAKRDGNASHATGSGSAYFDDDVEVNTSNVFYARQFVGDDSVLFGCPDNDAAGAQFGQWDGSGAINAYVTLVTTNGSEAVMFSEDLDINSQVDQDVALTAAGDAQNVALTINHASANAEAIDAAVTQLTTNRSGGIVSVVKASNTSLAGDSGGTYSCFEGGATDGGGSARHNLLYSADAMDAFAEAAASGDAGLTVSADGMFKDPEADTEAGYGTIRINGTDYQFPLYASA